MIKKYRKNENLCREITKTIFGITEKITDYYADGITKSTESVFSINGKMISLTAWYPNGTLADYEEFI